ncbi:MAG: hypothetical protein IT236_17780 [Bacteroidia bacterium]|nr:hypothetical protein [Bacteroidia bacterium]
MAILSINEFTERVHQKHIPCKQCRNGMKEVSIRKTDALLFLFGLKKVPHRYICDDCGLEIKLDKD